MISSCHTPPSVFVSAAQANIRASGNFVRKSKIYNTRCDAALPKLLLTELTTGSHVGRGSFSNVYEIVSICLEKSFKHTKQQVKSREILENYVKEEDSEDCRYVVKILREDLAKYPKRLQKSSVNLALEAKILSSIKHPNIIRLRGICCAKTTAFITGEGAGIILDKIYETLDQRIISWNLQETKKKSLINKAFCQKRRKSYSMLNSKLNVVIGISATTSCTKARTERRGYGTPVRKGLGSIPCDVGSGWWYRVGVLGR